jgi:integrase|tara:strand:+ start:195 stop:1346 length:1152 start_codon:yes stop_codon:yes gene_type:complete
MGKTKYKNVRAVSESSIQITFYYPSKPTRQRETIELIPTPDNLEKAFTHLAAINVAIKNGTFDYSVTFPNSPRARKYQNNRLLKTWLKNWLHQQDHLKQATINDYRKVIDGQIDNTKLGSMRIAAITWGDIKNWALSKKVCSKTKRNYMSVLRTALNDAADEGMIEYNPMIGKKLKQSKVELKSTQGKADPFSWQERQAIEQHAHDQFKWFCQFGFWTGMRISELIALEWDRIDWIHGTARVDQVLTQASRVYELPKTQHSIRDVELHGPALEALKQMKQFTFLEGGIIFRNPFDGLPWNGDSPVRKKWKGLLKKAGVRYRAPKQVRHTYASTALMEGEDTGYVCDQLGHEDESVTFRHYNQFIKGNRVQRGSKLEAAWKAQN